MQKLLKKYLYSDMDGTLISDGGTISTRNRDALLRFTAAGGRFAVATGRNVDITLPFLDFLPVNAPAILYNGAAVYDFQEKRFLHKECLPPRLAGRLLEIASEVYPGGCPEIFMEGPIRVLEKHGAMDHYIAKENQPYELIPLRASYEGAFKAMVYGEHSELERVRAAVEREFGPGELVWTYSSPFYLEFLAPKATKGGALHWIEENLGASREDICAIGDFYNDKEMLRAASLGVTVENAPNDIKEIADLVVRDNNHHAIEDLVFNHLIING